jgi:hypothetical protein
MDDTDTDTGGSEFSDYPSDLSISSEIVAERLRELESDPESGWFEEERYKFCLVRVPNNLLGVLRYQVRSGDGSKIQLKNYCGPRVALVLQSIALLFRVRPVPRVIHASNAWTSMVCCPC